MLADKVNIWQVGVNQMQEYEKIPMLVQIKSILEPTKVDGGLGGIIFNEIKVNEYVKDLGQYCNQQSLAQFDTSNWAFFIAYIDKMPVGGAIVAARTKGLNMLEDRADMAVLWDLRVNDRYQRKGVGGKLFEKVVDWASHNKYQSLKIESQNNNVKACRFYAKRGATLTQINEYAYYDSDELKDEIQLIWHLKL